MREAGYYFWPRKAHKGDPAGVTVTKRAELPNGDFGITEYSWGAVDLWFLDDDEFTAAERQEAYESFLVWRLERRRGNRHA